MTVLSPTGQDAVVVTRAAGRNERVWFLNGAALSDVPPRLASLWYKLGRLMQSVHLSFLRIPPNLAVVVPTGCQVESLTPTLRLLSE